MPSIARTPSRSKEFDRLLKRLEGKYDRPSKHVRDYYTDLGDIKTLLDNDVIDRDHADLLVERAKAKLQEEEDRRKEPEVIEPVLMYRKKRTDWDRLAKVIGTLIGSYIFVWYVLIPLWF